MAKLNPSDFVQWLEKQRKDGCGYLMGAVGQKTSTLTEGSWLVSQYKSNASQYAKAKYWLKNAPRVFDCQGLADCYVSEQTGTKTNVYARNNYDKWCSVKGTGMIPVDKRVPGAAVFIYSKSSGRITHVGFLTKPVDANKPEGDWYVVEARGVMYGVVRTKLLSRPWNRWGLMDKYFDYSEPKNEYKLGDRTLKEGMSGSDVKELKTKLMQLGYKLDVNEKFDNATTTVVNSFKIKYGLTADGKVGAGVVRKLEELLANSATVTITGGSVNIRKGPGTSYDVFKVAHKGDKFERAECADNNVDGWIPIIINGSIYWVSARYAE